MARSRTTTYYLSSWRPARTLCAGNSGFINDVIGNSKKEGPDRVQDTNYRHPDVSAADVSASDLSDYHTICHELFRVSFSTDNCVRFYGRIGMPSM